MRASHLLAVSVLTAGLTIAGFTTYSDRGMGRSGYPGRPAATGRLGDLVAGHTTTQLQSSADDVGALLEEQGVTLGAYDEVHPALDARLTPNETVRVVRVTNWTRTVQQPIAAKTVHRISLSLAPGRTKILSNGTPGVRETMVRFTQRDGGNIAKNVVGTRVLRSAKPRVIAEGVGEYEAFVRFEGRGLDKTAYVARAALTMIATAYRELPVVPASRRAVVPRTRYRRGRSARIRLGTRRHLGHGYAAVGDTGGAIWQPSISASTCWATRCASAGTVTVYRLK